ASFFLGAGLFGLFGKRLEAAVFAPLRLENQGNQSIFRMSVILLILCTIYIVLITLLGVLPVFGTYAEYRIGAANALFYNMFLIILSLGLTFLLATGSRKQIYRHIVWFVIPAIFLLVSGNRGEVFYAGAASIAVLSSR